MSFFHSIIESMASIATHRTPISILQEVCVKKGITPVYELVSSEGPIHEPNYVFLCSAGPFSATSKGKPVDDVFFC